MSEVLDRIENKGIQKGIQEGIQEGIQKGEGTIIALMNYLFNNGRVEDAKRATEDEAFRNKLLKELFGIDR